MKTLPSLAFTGFFSALVIGSPGAVAAEQAGDTSSSDAVGSGVALTITDKDSVSAVETGWMSGAKGETKGGKGLGSCKDDARLAAAVAGSHKGVFYDNNFDYLCDPCYDDWHLGDNLKRLGIGHWVVVDVGGQYRLRQQSERNIRNTAAVPNALGLTGADDDFLLHRTRIYTNVEIGTRLRFYGEMLDAVSQYEDLRPRGIEENRAEMQNLFLDVLAWDGINGSLTARVGRQELLYGNQRVVSPLDWANTRRTFEGAKLLWQGRRWDIDAFWVRPMRRDVDALDPPDLDREFYGIYSTYKCLEQATLELYWLALDFHDVGFLYDTMGGRYYRDSGAWHYELEAGVQFGENADGSDHSAGAWTLGVGRTFAGLPWNPTIWGYYDWASGDDTVGNGYHHFQPLSHKYMGFMDLFGRRNLEDANVQLVLKPADKVKLLLWYHYFRLQNGNDVPYNVNMTPFAGLTAGSAGSRDLGHEIDTVLTYTIGPRTNVLFGYSHFFAGDFYNTTAGVPYSDDADFFYTQLLVNF